MRHHSHALVRVRLKWLGRAHTATLSKVVMAIAQLTSMAGGTSGPACASVVHACWAHAAARACEVGYPTSMLGTSSDSITDRCKTEHRSCQQRVPKWPPGLWYASHCSTPLVTGQRQRETSYLQCEARALTSPMGSAAAQRAWELRTPRL
jgi:hypothetical protein